MSWVLTVYILILLLDLLAGCAMIIWKCTESGADIECQLSVSVTIATVAIWMLVVLVCPCFMSRCELCFLVDNILAKCAFFVEKIDPRKHETLNVTNEIYLPTTISLLENAEEGGSSMHNIDDTRKLIELPDSMI